MRAKYVMSEVAVGLWRNVTMTIAMIITMTVSLALLGASVLMFLQVRDMKNYYYAEVEVAIFLTDEITEEQQSALKDGLGKDPLVKSQIYESKDEAYRRFREQFRDAPDLVNATKSDALPASFRVKLNDPSRFDEIRQKYQDYGGVEEIVDQRKVLDKLFKMLSAVQGVSLVIAVIQGLAALLLVANTIQVAAYSRRREVAIMRMVGASNLFIQAPFVLEAIFAGVIGAVLACGVLLLAKVFVLGSDALKPLEGVLTPLGWLQVVLMLPLLAGIAAVISALTAWVTLRFYIKA